MFDTQTEHVREARTPSYGTPVIGRVPFFCSNGALPTMQHAKAFRQQVHEGMFLENRDSILQYVRKNLDNLASGRLKRGDLCLFEIALETWHQGLPTGLPKPAAKRPEQDEYVEGVPLSALIARHHPSTEIIGNPLRESDRGLFFISRSLVAATVISRRTRKGMTLSKPRSPQRLSDTTFDNKDQENQFIRACLEDAKRLIKAEPRLLGPNTAQIYAGIRSRIARKRPSAAKGLDLN
ncbi:MAG: hypothetical protein IPI58_04245 [Alphaproteobacteria bacterium]|nr:MAG: hypothetical protein IPI58_04245 [Alphaproteobacteria bacterium]